MKVRPITLMVGVAAVVAVVAVALSWRADDTTVGQPAALPLALDRAAGASSATTVMARPDLFPLDHLTYVRGPGVPGLEGERSAWVVRAAAPDRAAMTRLADALDVRGAIRDESGVLVVGDAGGRVLQAGGPLGAVWYFADAASLNGTVSCAQAGAGSTGSGPQATPQTTTPDQPASEPCPEPTPPAGVPDAPTAEAGARRILQQAGVDVTGSTVSVDAQPWAATVRFSPVVDGAPVEGMDTAVVFGAGGAVQSANGWFGRPVRGDRYPLIGVDAAIARLQRGEGLIGPQPMMATNATGIETAVAPEGSTTTSIPGESTVTVPAPTIPQAREVTVTITEATLVLAAVPGTDGSIYLVPAYRLGSADQGSWTVLAIDDSFIATTASSVPPRGPTVSEPGVVPGGAPESMTTLTIP